MKLDTNRIRTALSEPELPVYLYDSLDSTSEECRRRLAAGEKACLVLAEGQLAGKGRNGKAFFSPKGTGLYMSLAFSLKGDAANAVGITTFAAVCTAQAIERLSGIRCGIKWVNDLYLCGRKVCGILAEAVDDSVIVGVGVNLQPSVVPADLEPIVGFLGCGDIRNELAAEVTNGLLSYRPGDLSHMEEYRARSVVIGRQIRFSGNGRVCVGTAVNIDDSGGLVADTAEGRMTLYCGEISLTGIE